MDVFKWECMLGELEHCMGEWGMTKGGSPASDSLITKK